jgi:RHS repeat-associated protein
MPTRHESSAGYRYGFNGKENDNTIKGTGNSVDFGARMYDPRIGRWFKLDPKMEKGAFLSPYNYTNDNPVSLIDPDGKWAIWVHYRMTKRALIKVGISRRTAKKIAYFASTNADHPKGLAAVLSYTSAFVVALINLRNPFKLFPKAKYKEEFKKTKDSQNDEGIDVVRHAMRAYYEDEKKVSEEDAVSRALFGGNMQASENGSIVKVEGAFQILDKYKGKNLDKLTNAQLAEIGKAIHMIQDAWAHLGGKWAKGREHKKYAKDKGDPARHSTWRDVFGNTSGAKNFTKEVINYFFKSKKRTKKEQKNEKDKTQNN